MEENLTKVKKSIQEINDTIKKSNIRIIGILEDVERETGLKEVFHVIIKENFPNTGNIRGSHYRRGTEPQRDSIQKDSLPNTSLSNSPQLNIKKEY